MKTVIFCLLFLTSLYSVMLFATEEKHFIKNLAAALAKSHQQTTTPALNQNDILMGYGGEDVSKPSLTQQDTALV